MLSAEQDGFLVLLIGFITLLFTVLLITFALMVNLTVNRETVAPTVPVRAVKPLWPRPRYPFLTPSGHTATRTPLPDIKTPSAIDEPSLDGAPYPAPYGTPTLDDSLSSELPLSAVPLEPLPSETPLPSNQASPALTLTPIVLLTSTTTNTPIPNPSITSPNVLATIPSTADGSQPIVTASIETNIPVVSPTPLETTTTAPSATLLATLLIDNSPTASNTSTSAPTTPTTISTSTIRPPSNTARASDTATTLPSSTTTQVSNTPTTLPPSATTQTSDTPTTLPPSATTQISNTPTISPTLGATMTATPLGTVTVAPGSTPYPPPSTRAPTPDPYN